MNPIHFARAMRKLGWRVKLLGRDRVAFGLSFANGRGITRVITTRMLVALIIPAAAYAELVTSEATHSFSHLKAAA